MALDDVDLQDQVVQYVLGELPAADARALEARMTSDEELAVEVRRLRATLGLLPFSTVAEPPPDRRSPSLASSRSDVMRVSNARASAAGSSPSTYWTAWSCRSTSSSAIIPPGRRGISSW